MSDKDRLPSVRLKRQADEPERVLLGEVLTQRANELHQHKACQLSS